jgi:hypothetical protein
VKAAVVRQVAERYASAQLAEAIAALTEDEVELLEIEGDDAGERLTHLLLAQRIRRRMDAGLALKDAFRAEMGQVRDTLTNS